MSSGSFAVPARQRRRSQRPCTKPYCAHVERCILVAAHCGLARLSPAALMSHLAAGSPPGSPQLQWLGCTGGAGPRPKHPHASLALGVGWAEAPAVARCFHTYNLSKRFNTLCRKRSGRTPGIRRSARHAGLAGIVAADASGPLQHELLKVGALWTAWRRAARWQHCRPRRGAGRDPQTTPVVNEAMGTA